MTKPSNAEVGRELLASEIRRGQIVLLRKATCDGHISSFWVDGITETHVWFYSGVLQLTFIAKRLPDGHITDDSGLEMAMYLYLGKP